jgi:hypothetical protein
VAKHLRAKNNMLAWRDLCSSRQAQKQDTFILPFFVS